MALGNHWLMYCGCRSVDRAILLLLKEEGGREAGQKAQARLIEFKGRE